ncbi:MAG: 6-carboxytetrahydropterin synthase QueD [Kiritimatiellae bacterium]|nr:6-carboxytetrahydropterin synthase QueD [Kiritimatiellia bacterium]
MYTLIVKETFEAAHTIPEHSGKCKNLHGHSYRVEAEFSGDELDSMGMVKDFADLKKAVRRILPDHTYLNDVLDGPTTAEYIAQWIFTHLKQDDLPVTAVTVWETENCGCLYKP